MSDSELYIHGYSEEEQARLIAQNEVLAPYIYRRIELTGCRTLVEIGCGVGAQMMYLLGRYTDLHITGIELSPRQLRRAELHLSGIPSYAGRYDLVEGDATMILPPGHSGQDAALLVWVLEHVPEPLSLLQRIREWLPEGRHLFLTEVCHSSLLFYPDQPDIMAYWEDTLRCQRRLGGDPDVGLKLFSLLAGAGFNEVEVWPHTFMLDGSRPQERATLLAYWLDLMRSALHQTLASGDTTLARWQTAETAMRRLMEREDAVFHYSFMQARAAWAGQPNRP